MAPDSLFAALLSSREPFQAWGPSHLTVIGLSFAVAALLVRWGRARRTDPWHPRLVFAIGLTIVISELTFCLYPVYQGRWRPDWALPLQLCDMTAFATGFGMMLGHATLLEIGFFLGLSGTLLTSASPDLERDFPNIEFFCFFLTHALVSVAAVYYTFGLDRRPRPLAAWRVWLTVNAVGLCIAALNTKLGSNYLYICRKPPVASPFDYMGPWPHYVIVLDLTLAALLALLTWVARAAPVVSEKEALP